MFKNPGGSHRGFQWVLNHFFGIESNLLCDFKHFFDVPKLFTVGMIQLDTFFGRAETSNLPQPANQSQAHLSLAEASSPRPVDQHVW